MPQLAARTVVPVGTAMSMPLWAWSPRLSPYWPVTVPPLTGVTMRPSVVQPPPPVDTGAAGSGTGAGAGSGAGGRRGGIDGDAGRVGRRRGRRVNVGRGGLGRRPHGRARGHGMGVVVVEHDLRCEQLGPGLGVDHAGRRQALAALELLHGALGHAARRSRHPRPAADAARRRPPHRCRRRTAARSSHRSPRHAGRPRSWSLPAAPSSPTPPAATAPGWRGWPRRRPASRPSGAGRCAAQRPSGPAADVTGAATAPTARRSQDHARLSGTDPARMDVSPRSVLPSFFPVPPR